MFTLNLLSHIATQSDWQSNPLSNDSWLPKSLVMLSRPWRFLGNPNPVTGFLLNHLYSFFFFSRGHFRSTDWHFPCHKWPVPHGRIASTKLTSDCARCLLLSVMSCASCAGGPEMCPHDVLFASTQYYLCTWIFPFAVLFALNILYRSIAVVKSRMEHFEESREVRERAKKLEEVSTSLVCLQLFVL